MKKYVILDKIAANQQREVYKARDPLHQRVVVIKTWIDQEKNNEQKIKSILKNKKNITKLQHPYIAPIYQIGVGKNIPFLVMQHIEGSSLENLVTDNIPLKDSLEILAKVAMALDYAHRQGVVHGDIKPSNIIIGSDGEPKIIDFGFGILSGDLHYMSPEQISEKRIDKRSDVYALGVVLYKLSTGKYPFEGNSAKELIYKILNKEYVLPCKINSDLPSLFDNLCSRAMVKEKTERCNSAKDFFLILSGKKNSKHTESRNNKHLLTGIFVLSILIILVYIFFYT